MTGFFPLASIKARKRNRRGVPVLVLLVLLFMAFGCGDFTLFGDEDSDGTVEAVVVVSDEEPTACSTEEVTLDGTESYGEDLTYSWSLSVPEDSEASLEDDDADETFFSPDKPGTYYVILTVTDEDDNTDYVTVSVVAVDIPIADADVDSSVVCVGEEVAFDGTGSKDPNPTDDDYECSYEELSFSWELTSVPDGSESVLDDPDLVDPRMTPNIAGTYIATLTVTRDEDDESSEDAVYVVAQECD